MAAGRQLSMSIFRNSAAICVVMAVAYKDNAFGSATKNMKVADPVVISAGLPRFLSPGDELVLPVNISNTEKSADATVSVQFTGPLAGRGNYPKDQYSRRQRKPGPYFR
jgi:uncharacterized protein YfaS (alpha-2-macroglobulin family)